MNQQPDSQKIFSDEEILNNGWVVNDAELALIDQAKDYVLITFSDRIAEASTKEINE